MSHRLRAAEAALRAVHLPRAPHAAANDDGAPDAATLLRTALRQFATYGMGAAGEARREAERAHDRGDAQQAFHWLAVCALLDRRLAARPFEPAAIPVLLTCKTGSLLRLAR